VVRVDTFVSTFYFAEVLNIGKEKGTLINNQIKAIEIRVVGPKGEPLGIKKTADALTLATASGFDLVMVSGNANPPVCKLMDYNKYKYEKQKQVKEAKKRQRESNLEMKTYRLSPNIDIGDFNTVVRKASKYLEKGHRIKADIRFRGREMVHTNRGFDVMKRFAESLSELSEVESRATMDGYFMKMILAPKKEK